MGFSVSLGFIDPCSFESQASKTPGRDGTQQGPIGGMDLEKFRGVFDASIA